VSPFAVLVPVQVLAVAAAGFAAFLRASSRAAFAAASISALAVSSVTLELEMRAYEFHQLLRQLPIQFLCRPGDDQRCCDSVVVCVTYLLWNNGSSDRVAFNQRAENSRFQRHPYTKRRTLQE
jgi:hypothetical protein